MEVKVFQGSDHGDWSQNVHHYSLEEGWLWAFHEWIVSFLEVITERKEALHLRNSILVRVMSKGHQGCLVFVEVWKVKAHDGTGC